MLDLIGAVALLLWGLRMVKTGVSRAFGSRLRRWIAAGTRNRFLAFGIGLIATMALQSSTATALMTASFAGRGFMSSAMAQAIMLGANVGTSIVTRVLAFDIHWLAPMLLAAGVVGFTYSETKPNKGIARALLGLGLMLLSLHLLGQATEPMRQSQVLTALMASLDAVPVLAVLVAAVLAIASSSSLVVVLLVMSLAATGAVGPGLAIALVLGANVGGAVAPMLATLGDGSLSRRVGNLLVRLLGCAIVLPFAGETASLLSTISDSPSKLVVDAHILFNIALTTVMLPLLGPFSAATRKLLPLEAESDGGPRYLDATILDRPAMALAAAARETLRIGDCVTSMLESSLEALRKNDTKRCASLAEMDDEVDRLNNAVKLYLAGLNQPTLTEKDEKRSSAIIAHATNLEHVGDIVDKNLRKLVEKKIKHQLSFSTEGATEIEEFYRVTIENLRLAQSILISGDEKLARQLVEAKVDIRHLEERSAANHMGRLRDGRIESVQTSALHLDILRDLKRINAHIAAIAYPILAEAGGLRETRLMEVKGSV